MITVTRKQIRNLIESRLHKLNESREQYDIGYEDAMQGITPQQSDDAYIRGYDEGSAAMEDLTWEEEADQYTTYGEDDPDHVGYKGNPWALEEKDGSTQKYNDDSALRGKQSKLPDALQKGIIDKTVEDREEHEAEEREKNESIRHIRNIVRESMVDLGIAVIDEEDYPQVTISRDGRMMDYGHQKSDSHEGRMTKAKLFRMARMSQSLSDRLDDGDDLPEWVQDKITTAEDRLGSAFKYIDYKLHRLKVDGQVVTESKLRNIIKNAFLL